MVVKQCKSSSTSVLGGQTQCQSAFFSALLDYHSLILKVQQIIGFNSHLDFEIHLEKDKLQLA